MSKEFRYFLQYLEKNHPKLFDKVVAVMLYYLKHEEEICWKASLFVLILFVAVFIYVW
jgi:hypothetical protein